MPARPKKNDPRNGKWTKIESMQMNRIMLISAFQSEARTMSQSQAKPPPPPRQRLTLIPPGERELVDEERAQQIVASWNAEIEQYRAKCSIAGTAADPYPVEKLCLSVKSYSAGAATILASWLTRGESPIANGIAILDASDIIAKRDEDEALQVLRIICDCFAHAKLVEVDLSDNALGSKGANACRSVLSGQAETLQRLSLCNNGLASQTMHELADILTEDAENGSDSACVAENLTKIHFYNNMSGDGGCAAFARILSRCTSALDDIRFSGVRGGREGSQVVASALAAMGDNVRNIRRLDFADMTFGAEGCKDLALVLSKTTKLEYLDLRDCVCEDEGMKLVCHSLWSADPPLEEFNVSGNDLSKSGARGLADFLEENRTIRIFSCCENEITSLGAKIIFEALSDSTAIEEIRLDDNEIGDIGGSAIVQAYGPGEEKMPALSKICLDHNGFSDDCVDRLLEAFGEQLIPMEENDNEADFDDALSVKDSEDDSKADEDEDVDDVGHADDADIDALTAQVQGATLDHDLL